MIPVGYLRKKITARPEWLRLPAVANIVAVSDCVMKDVIDVFTLGRFNGWYFYDSSTTLDELLRAQGADFDGTVLLYSEVFESAYDRDARAETYPYEEFLRDTPTDPTDKAHAWIPLPSSDGLVNVQTPTQCALLGYDVCSFSMGNAPECCPLSCNSIAQHVEVNEHGLFASLENAKAALERGFFDRSEPGPLRIFAIHLVNEAAKNRD